MVSLLGTAYGSGMAAEQANDLGKRVWVLSEDWCGAHNYSTFRWFDNLGEAVAWIEANPPQQYQDFHLRACFANGLPAADYRARCPQPEPGWTFPGEIGSYMDCPEWVPGKPFPEWDGVSRNRSILPVIEE